MPEAITDIHRKALADIESYGLSVMSVFDPEQKLPPFTYSIGVYQTQQQPELLVIGLEHKLAHRLTNLYAARLTEGWRPQFGQDEPGFLEGFAVRFEPLSPDSVEPYMRLDFWLYEPQVFPAVQMVYPTTKGIWPWQEEAPESFRALQPLLYRSSSREL